MLIYQAAQQQELSGDANTVAWICFILGLLLVVAGTIIGLVLSFIRAEKKVEEKAKEVQQKVEQLQAGAESQQVQAAAEANADAAKKALEELKGIIASLPENLRFAGLLILVGALLMSVGTIQFGGISIF